MHAGTRLLLVVAVVGIGGCSDGPGGGDAGCDGGAKIVTPIVVSGGVEVTATAGAVYSCDARYGMSHGDGPLVFGDEPVRLDATDDVVVRVADGLEVRTRWDAGEFEPGDGDDTLVAPLPPTGCHRLGLDVADPGSDNKGDFAVMVAVGGVNCAPPPPIEGFHTLGITPSSIEVTVGKPLDVDVVVGAVNPPDGYFCPLATHVSGPKLTTADFILGCTASGTGSAILRLEAAVAGTTVLAITAHTQDGTAAEESVEFIVTVTG